MKVEKIDTEKRPRANRARRNWGNQKGKAYTRGCNLCKHDFIARSPFDRFCGTCKSEKDLFRFAEWLPNLPIAI